MKVILYGYKVSHIKCSHEASVRAKRLNTKQEIRYSSTHFIINYVQLGKEIYRVDKYQDVERASTINDCEIDEERLLLEVSCRYKEGKHIEEHKHIEEIRPKVLHALYLNSEPYFKRNHISKIVRQDSKNILSYFLKCFGDTVSNVEEMSCEDEQYLLTSHKITVCNALISIIPNVIQFVNSSISLK